MQILSHVFLTVSSTAFSAPVMVQCIGRRSVYTTKKRDIQYPSEARYKANVFHTYSERVSHEQRTRLGLRANAFRSSCERVSHAERTCFSRLLRGEGLARERVLVLVQTFWSSCERVSHAERTRFGPCANAFHMRIIILTRACV